MIPYSIGWALIHFEPAIAFVGMIFDTIGWILLISGQSVVLYSRLHLVLHNTSILRAVLWMIICNGVVWHTSITVLLFGSTYSPSRNRNSFNAVYNVMEKVQMTFFCLQEFTISGLYIWATLDILRTAFGNKRRFMWRLFTTNVLIVIMDVALLAVEYKSFFAWEQGLKVVIYSIKLKLEFAVLNELVKFVQHRGDACATSTSHCHITSPLEPSGDLPRPKDPRAQSTSIPEAIHMEELQVNAVGCVTSETSNDRENNHGQIRTAAMMDMEYCAVDLGDNRNTRHLYENAIRQVSRSYSGP